MTKYIKFLNIYAVVEDDNIIIKCDSVYRRDWPKSLFDQRDTSGLGGFSLD